VARGGLRLPTAQEAALSLAFGGLVAGVGAGSIALDRGVENVLRRRGVRAPRVWMGLASGALTLALAMVDERERQGSRGQDRKSTRLNSSHVSISYAVFCLDEKKAGPRYPPAV